MNLEQFKVWLDEEFAKYPLLAKSSPHSMNELCYVLRLSGKDFAVCWNTDNGFSCIPSVAEAFIPSRDLARKVKLVDYDPAVESEDIEGCLQVEIIREVIYPESHIEKALEPPKDKIFDYCAHCGGEIYEGETVYNIDGQLIHEDCLHDFADDYFKDCKEEAVSYAEAYC